MADSNSIGPLDSVKTYAAASWATGNLSLVNGNGECARYLQVVAVGASPSLVLNLRNGESVTLTDTNARIAAGWETPRPGVKIASIGQATANVTGVLVGW